MKYLLIFYFIQKTHLEMSNQLGKMYNDKRICRIKPEIGTLRKQKEIAHIKLNKSLHIKSPTKKKKAERG